MIFACAESDSTQDSPQVLETENVATLEHIDQVPEDDNSQEAVKKLQNNHDYEGAEKPLDDEMPQVSVETSVNEVKDHGFSLSITTDKQIYDPGEEIIATAIL